MNQISYYPKPEEIEDTTLASGVPKKTSDRFQEHLAEVYGQPSNPEDADNPVAPTVKEKAASRSRWIERYREEGYVDFIGFSSLNDEALNQVRDTSKRFNIWADSAIKLRDDAVEETSVSFPKIMGKDKPASSPTALTSLIEAVGVELHDVAEKHSIDKALELGKKALSVIQETQDSAATTQQTGSPPRLDDLGLPLHPLSEEVQSLIRRTESGEKVFPDYMEGRKAGRWKNPLEYLEVHYGKYLKRFNGEADYIYLDQLGRIDSKFRDTIRSYVRQSLKNESLHEIVPPKSRRLDKEAAQFSGGDQDRDKKIMNKINSLRQSRFT